MSKNALKDLENQRLQLNLAEIVLEIAGIYRNKIVFRSRLYRLPKRHSHCLIRV